MANIYLVGDGVNKNEADCVFNRAKIRIFAINEHTYVNYTK